MPKIINKSPGPRGVHTKSGTVFLAPGETRDLEVSAEELKSLSEDWFAVGALSKADKADVDDAKTEAVETDDAARARRAAEAQAAQADAKK